MNRYDEGTAFMPIVTRKNQLPLPVRERYRFLAPDADTYDLPSDWYFNSIILRHIYPTLTEPNSSCRYMRICGMVVEVLRGDRRLLDTFPHKELQDYWSSRPRYEDGTGGGYLPAGSKPGASGSGLAHALAVEENPNEPPPPPYSLEADNGPEKSHSPTQDGFLTAPTSPNDKQNYNVSDLANDLGRHTLGGPSTAGPPVGPPLPAFANRPISPPRTTTPLTTPPLPSSYFPPPTGPSQNVGIPSIPVPLVSHESVNLSTPFHWDDDYPNPQSQPPGGYNINTNPQEKPPLQSGYQPSYTPPLPPPQHTRPPVHPAMKPAMPPQSPHEGVGVLNSSQGGYNPPYSPSQSTYPGQIEPNSYYGYDKKTDGKGKDAWGGPPPLNSPYPGLPGQKPPQTYPGSGFTPQSLYPGQMQSGPPSLSNSPALTQSYGQHQSSYSGMTNTPTPGAGRPPPPQPGKSHSWPPVSNSPPLAPGPGGYGQPQSFYPGMTNSPSPGPQDRPPTRPPTSNSPQLIPGYGQQQSSYPGMTSSPILAPDLPPTSHTSRPTTPYHQGVLPPQVHPPLPGGYGYSGPTQSTYSGMKPSASPPPPPLYQPTGPSPYGYQQPPQQQQSSYPGYNPPPPGTSYPGYPGPHPPPPLPPRKCHF